MDANKNPEQALWIISKTDRSAPACTLVAGPIFGGSREAYSYATSHRRMVSARPDLYPGVITLIVPAHRLPQHGRDIFGFPIS